MRNELRPLEENVLLASAASAKHMSPHILSNMEEDTEASPIYNQTQSDPKHRGNPPVTSSDGRGFLRASLVAAKHDGRTAASRICWGRGLGSGNSTDWTGDPVMNDRLGAPAIPAIPAIPCGLIHFKVMAIQFGPLHMSPALHTWRSQHLPRLTASHTAGVRAPVLQLSTEASGSGLGRRCNLCKCEGWTLCIRNTADEVMKDMFSRRQLLS